MKENIIQMKSFEFALKSIELYKMLLDKNEYVLSRQFFRSATSIGANVEEATMTYSKKEFAAKMGIASKEARETAYWLKLIKASGFIHYDYTELEIEIESIIKILTSIVKTAQTNIQH
ncbi:MAG: four helix bundle protein [Sphingobacteriales bacterium]|nr:MAG: four helix bundle protein [Sphingobacteriales bacterium]